MSEAVAAHDADLRTRFSVRLRRLVPIVAWLPAYPRADLRPDLVAGLTSWGVMVPVALAYALLRVFRLSTD